MKEPKRIPLDPDNNRHKEPNKIPLPPLVTNMYDDFGHVLTVEAENKKTEEKK